MTDVYTQESASKKKFLAPVLVILLCMVSLTAAGYAYSATIDNTGDDIDIKGVTMELSTDDAIFSVDDIAIGTHTTNGKALWYAVHKAFDDENNYTDAAYTGDLNDYADGYYVEVAKGTNDSGYNEFVASNAEFDKTVDELKALGVYKISADDLNIKITNKSDVSINLRTTVTGPNTVIAGIKDVYLVIKNDASVVVGFESFKTAGYTDIAINQAISSTEKTYTVEVYVAISDYLSADLPQFPAAAYDFAVSFESVAVA